jgi:hypothetical protein
MYKIISSNYGQLSAKDTVEKATYWANAYATKAESDEIITVWKDGEKVLEISQEKN